MFQISLLHCALPSEKRTLFSAGVRNFRTAHYRESNRQLRTLRGKMYVRFVLRERETEFKGSLCNIARSSPVRRLTPAGVAMPYSTALVHPRSTPYGRQNPLQSAIQNCSPVVAPLRYQPQLQFTELNIQSLIKRSQSQTCVRFIFQHKFCYC